MPQTFKQLSDKLQDTASRESILRAALEVARQQITTLGTPDDAMNNAVLKLIDEALAS